MKNSLIQNDIDKQQAALMSPEPVNIDMAEREAAREQARTPLFKTSHTPMSDSAVRVTTVDAPMPSQDRSVRELQREAWLTAENHGFHSVQSFCEKLMLMVSELSEALEDFRDGKAPDETWYEDDGKKLCGIPSEFADVFIRLVDAAECYGIDLQAAIEDKMEYNKTRPFLHGKTL